MSAQTNRQLTINFKIIKTIILINQIKFEKIESTLIQIRVAQMSKDSCLEKLDAPNDTMSNLQA